MELIVTFLRVGYTIRRITTSKVLIKTMYVNSKRLSANTAHTHAYFMNFDFYHTS